MTEAFLGRSGQAAELHILLQSEIRELIQEARIEDGEHELPAVVLDGERDFLRQGLEKTENPIEVYDARSDPAGKGDDAFVPK